MSNYALNGRNSRAHARLTSDVMSAGLVVGRIQVEADGHGPTNASQHQRKVFMWKILLIVVILVPIGLLVTWSCGYGLTNLLGPTAVLLTLMLFGYIPRGF
jgi:hypothetical protein